MIERIGSISGLGLFASQGKSPDFQRYNLIYGWNGSGKTTLSGLFESLPEGRHADFAGLKYSLMDDKTTYTQGSIYPRPVMVFNRRFIRENAPSLEDPETPSRHIFIIGEKDKELAKNVNDAQKERDELIKACNVDDKAAGRISLSTQMSKNTKLRDAAFTDVARTIATIGGGKAVRNYNRRQAEPAFGALAGKELLTEPELKSNLALMGQEVRQELLLIELGAIEEDLNNVLKSSASLMGRTITRSTVKELDESRDYAEWAARGYQLHSEHEDEMICTFCGQTMPEARWKLLAEYFNREYEKIVADITNERDRLRICYERIMKLELVDAAAVYPDLKDGYSSAIKAFADSRTGALEQIRRVGEALNEKLAKLNIALNLVDMIDLHALTAAAVQINEFIGQHNKRSKEFEKSQVNVFKKLEKHYLSEQYDTINDLNSKIRETEQQIAQHTKRIAQLNAEIKGSEAEMRNTKIACNELNELIALLLGRDEIQIEDNDTGYYIRRQGEVAVGLSEGEQTVIAFAYFLIMLQNNGGNVKDMLIVVDDPISSLDADAVYRVAALIKTKLNKAHQLIILTHNYDLLNQIKKWFSIGSLEGQSAMLMVKNPVVGKKRTAAITAMDPLIEKYESEYHYLFARLLNYDHEVTADEKGTIAGVYHYPNIARKVLECYLSFRTPGADVYGGLIRLHKLAPQKITSADVDDVHNFVNSHSHLNTKTGLMQFDMKLAKNGVEYIQKTLEVIKNSDEEHYKAMVKAVGV